MVDSFYFLCIDEIYTPNLNQFLKLKKTDIFTHLNHWHFGIGGVIISAASLSELNVSLRKLQAKHYPKKISPVLHYNDILHSKDLYSDLAKDPRKKRSFTDSLCYWVNSQEYYFLASFIDSHELIKKYGTFDRDGNIKNIKKIRGNIYPQSLAKDYNLYSLALKFMMKEFYEFLSRKKFPARGIIISEARGKKEDIELRDTFYKLQCGSISTISPTNLRQTIVDLLIVHKNQNHGGLQLADLLLYPTYDAMIPNHSKRNDHFISFDRIIKSKLFNSKSIALFP